MNQSKLELLSVHSRLGGTIVTVVRRGNTCTTIVSDLKGGIISQRVVPSSSYSSSASTGVISQ